MHDHDHELKRLISFIHVYRYDSISIPWAGPGRHDHGAGIIPSSWSSAVTLF
jgi:hypothetical protein